MHFNGFSLSLQTDMRKLLLSAIVLVTASVCSVSCRMAPNEQLGDTLAASVFEPEDTMKGREVVEVEPDSAALEEAARALASIVDSTDIFVVGAETNRQWIQLLSYPSRRDTTLFGKGQHFKATGSTEPGTMVRVKFFALPSGTRIVTRTEQVIH